MDVLPSAHAWEVFGEVGVVVLFLSALGGALWHIGVLRRRRSESASAAGRAPSPEARALIESTQALISAVTVMAERTEAMGRVHHRLDEVHDRLAAGTTETAEMRGQLAQINSTLKLIHEYLLHHPS